MLRGKVKRATKKHKRVCLVKGEMKYFKEVIIETLQPCRVNRLVLQSEKFNISHQNNGTYLPLFSCLFLREMDQAVYLSTISYDANRSII